VTKKQAERMLRKDLKAYTTSLSSIPLSQNEYDAYASLAYNIGKGAFERSTLLKLLRRGEYEAACKEILKWDKFNGKPLKGLTIRRKKEYDLCTDSSSTAADSHSG
jgi:GH24 family phage-related lysozyme (muramidase)